MAATGKDLKALLEEIGMKPEAVRVLDPAAPLLKQGLDSVDFPAFCALLEERFHLSLDDDAALKLRTLDDFAAHINQARGKS